jgi:hypothetical protein
MFLQQGGGSKHLLPSVRRRKVKETTFKVVVLALYIKT